MLTTRGFEQALEAKAKFLKARTEAIELEKERERLEKETSEWRAKSKALECVTRHVIKNMATVDKIVEQNGGASSKQEADYLEVMSLFFAQNPESGQADGEAEALSPEKPEFSGNSNDDDNGGAAPYDDFE